VLATLADSFPNLCQIFAKFTIGEVSQFGRASNMRAKGILLLLLASFVLCSAQQANNAVIEGLERALSSARGSSRSAASIDASDTRQKTHQVSSFLQHRRMQQSVFGPALPVRIDQGKQNRGGGGGGPRPGPGGRSDIKAVALKGTKRHGKGGTRSDIKSLVLKGKKGSKKSGKGGKGDKGSKDSGKGAKKSSKGSKKTSSKGDSFCRDFTFHDRRRLQNGGEQCTPNILDIARGNSELSIFVDLIERAGLEEVFDCAGMCFFGESFSWLKSL